MELQTFTLKLTQIMHTPGLAQELLDYMKLLLLQNCPLERNNELTKLFESDNLENFIMLFQEVVPEGKQKIVQYVNQLL